MTRNQTVEINHLTVLQIQYLTELEQLEEGQLVQLLQNVA